MRKFENLTVDEKMNILVETLGYDELGKQLEYYFSKDDLNEFIDYVSRHYDVEYNYNANIETYEIGYITHDEWQELYNNFIHCGYTQTQEGDDIIYDGSEWNELQALYDIDNEKLIYIINDEYIYSIQDFDADEINYEIDENDLTGIIPNLLGEAVGYVFNV